MSAPQVVDIYELSPMQQGMLFHSLYAPDSGVYIVQYRCSLQGPLDTGAFRRAWQYLTDRHSILRTLLQWQELEKPVQVVFDHWPIALEELDWSDRSADEIEREFERLCAEQRRDGFDLAAAPPLRLTLIRQSPQRHRFAWTFHHLLLDGWSLGQLLQELIAVYRSLATGEQPRLAPARPYADYIGWLQQQDLAATEAFWRRTLAGYTGTAPLRPAATEGHRPTTTQLYLSPDETVALGAFASRHRLTVNTVLQGAWALLLERHSGEADTVFGAISTSRPADLPGVETMIGLFVNTLPVRVRVEPDAELVPWLQALQQHQAEVRQHDFASLMQIHGWSDVPGTQPLFETALCFENYPLDGPAGDAAQSELSFVDVASSEQVNFALALLVVPGTSLLLEMHHDERRYPPVLTERMLQQVRTLLTAMLETDGQRRLRALPLLGEAERRRLCGQWSGASRPVDPDATIHGLFAIQVRRRPQAIAAVFRDRRLTYAQLDQVSDRLARFLRRLGVTSETLVGLHLERSFAAVAGILGILKAGGAYVPLPPAYPPERLRDILDQTHPPVILSTDAAAPTVCRLAPESTFVLTDLPLAVQGPNFPFSDAPPTGPPADPQLPRVHPDQLAYVLFTSGSTGRPKGVQVPHRGLCNLAQVQHRMLGIDQDSRVLQLSSLSFDTSVVEILVPLAIGAQLCLGDGEQLLPNDHLVRVMEDQRVTWSVMPPSVLAALPDAELPDLATLVVAGEACPPELAEARHRSPSGRRRRFINGYGPTEATIATSFGDFQPGSDQISLGTPVDNVRVYLADARLRLVPQGASGQLLIGGISPTRGYIGRPALTALSFVPDDFGDTPGGRLYCTGDLACFDENGELHFLGRIDRQLKVRGQRLEPGDIEAALRQAPGVRQAAVLARGEGNDRQLVAFLVTDNGSEPPVDELRRFLGERLPAYMVPSSFTVLDRFPLTAHGKLDYRALARHDGPVLESGQAFVPPRNDLEARIAAVWAEVLEVERLGVHDNVFDLGAHSMKVVQAQTKMSAALGREVPLTALFNHPTVSALADHLSGRYGGPRAAERGQNRAEARKARRGRRRRGGEET